MKRKVLSILMILLCVFASCSKDNDIQPDQPKVEEGINDGKLAYVVSTGIANNGLYQVKISLANFTEEIGGAWVTAKGDNSTPSPYNIYYYDNNNPLYTINKSDKTIIYRVQDLSADKVYTVHIKGTKADSKIYTVDITVKHL